MHRERPVVLVPKDLKVSQGTRGLAIQGQAGNAQGTQGSGGGTGVSRNNQVLVVLKVKQVMLKVLLVATGAQGPTGTHVTVKTWAVTVVYSIEWWKQITSTLIVLSSITIYLLRGQKYVFDQSHSTNSNHPLRFSTTAEWNPWWNSGSQHIASGVTATGTPGQSGAKVEFIVPENAPNTLYYYCTNHSWNGW